MSNVVSSEQLVKTKVAANILRLDEGTLCNGRSNKLVDLPFIKTGRTVPHVRSWRLY